MEENKFGLVLEELIESRDLSIKDVSESTGIPYKTLVEYIGRDGRIPSKIDVFKKLATYFQIPLHELMFGEPDPSSIIGQILEKTEIHTGLYEISIKKVRMK